MPFFKPGFYQGHSVNLRTETRVLFFVETCFFFNNSLYLNNRQISYHHFVHLPLLTTKNKLFFYCFFYYDIT